MTVRLLPWFIRTGCVQCGKDQYVRVTNIKGCGMISKGRRTFWSDMLCSSMAQVLEKYPKEKSIIGLNKEARSSEQSPVHAVRTKRDKREKLRSESELARPKLILA